jgi:hypothetical protein
MPPSISTSTSFDLYRLSHPSPVSDRTSATSQLLSWWRKGEKIHWILAKTKPSPIRVACLVNMSYTDCALFPGINIQVDTMIVTLTRICRLMWRMAWKMFDLMRLAARWRPKKSQEKGDVESGSCTCRWWWPL